jgi:hypothetical protein
VIKKEQALQIFGHVVAEFYANRRSMHGRRQFVVSIIVHFIIIIDNGENVSNKQEQNFAFVKMCNLPALLPNATLLLSRFFAEMTKKR